MSWDDRILSEAALRPFLTSGAERNLAARANALLMQQQAAWSMLREAVAGFQQVEYKHFTIRGSEILAQFNPKRIVSTGAKVDAASIKARPCFLCPDNLPVEERGLAYGNNLVVLCNPFPVLPKHLVIAARPHTPQTLAGYYGALLELTRALGEEFFTLYNGPRCGASAPDHLHFQAAAAAWLPIWREVESWPLQRLKSAQPVEAFAFSNYRINVLGVRGNEPAALQDWLERAVEALAELTQSKEEPLLNVLARFKAGHWTVLLLPRQRHRPSCYDAAGEARLMVSPAAIDLGGVIVVPQAEHFARINETALEQVYAEVTLRDEVFDEWLKQLERY
jgi:hypothetical protein